MTRSSLSKWLTVFVLAAAVLGIPTSVATLSNVAGASVVPCTPSQLTLSTGQWQVAAGNNGLPIVVTNNGSAACVLDGFAQLSFLTKKPSPKPVHVFHRRESEIFAATTPRAVLLRAGSTASFGISYGDAYNQGPKYAQAPACLASRIRVSLPGTDPQHSYVLGLGMSGTSSEAQINVCTADFRFGITPIELGSAPKLFGA